MEDRDKEEVVMNVEMRRAILVRCLEMRKEEERGDKDLPDFPMTKPAPLPLI